jgi:membrane protease YdiL (CAAX protease family)
MMQEHQPTESRPDGTPADPPVRMVLFTLGGLVFLSMMLGSIITAVACDIQGIDIRTVFDDLGNQHTTDARQFTRGILLLNHTLTFLVPALLAGWLFYRTHWPDRLRLDRPPALTTTGLGLLFAAAAFPLAQLLFGANKWLVDQIPALRDLVAAETASENLIIGLLTMETPGEFAFNLLVMALLPAIGEEMVFRSFLQRQLTRLPQHPAVAISAAALVFSLAHFQVQRFLAIALLGVVLGLLFHWSRNLWIPILAHFLNNGAQVAFAWFNQDHLPEMNDQDPSDIPSGVYALASVLLVTSGFFLHRLRRPTS